MDALENPCVAWAAIGDDLVRSLFGEEFAPLLNLGLPGGKAF